MTDSHQRVAQGAVIIFLGNAAGMALAFLARVLPARFLTSSEYGVFVLGVTVLNILALTGHLGLYDGVARNIPRSSDKSGEFTAALLIGTAFSLVLSALLVISIPILTRVLGGEQLSSVLVVIALCLPSMVIYRISAGGFRGLEDHIGRVILQNVIMRGGVLVSIVAFLAAGYGVIGASAGWLSGLVFSTVAAFSLLYLRTDLLAPPRRWRGLVVTYTRPLLRFSIPLMGAATIWQLMQKVDNLLIGAFLESSQLGIYDAAFTLSQLLLLFFWPFGFLLLPVLSDLHSRNEFKEMQTLYSTTTKWMAIISFPSIAYLLLFSPELLATVFGESYRAGWKILSLISITLFVHVLAGTNKQALSAIGKTGKVFYGTTSAFIANICLNVILIPEYGILGAAVASATSYAVANVVFAFYLYRISGIQPISMALVKILSGSSVAIALTYALIPDATPSLVLLASVLPAFYIVHLIVVMSIGVDEYDREVVSSMLSKVTDQ
jgi:O-antigen/teichoic acid export membrane protein